MTSPEIRQTLGCGYLPQLPDATPWLHRGMDVERLEGTPPACPGYVCKLPEISEAARARLHWEKGTLTERCGGEPTEATLSALEELELAANACEAWRIEESNRRRS